MIGKTISHYKLLEKLGQGGMGVVYKALDTALNRMVALKFLPEAIAGEAEEKARFIREARAAAALDHPNIATVYEIAEAGEKLFIAMAYVEGETLKKQIASGKWQVKDAVDIAIQIAEGLKEAHDKGVIHRDIKSANVMVTPKAR
jgi:serine/threonine protein kinase